MSRGKLALGVAVLVAAGFGLYWFVFRGPTTDAGKLAAWVGSACDSDGGNLAHRVTAPSGYGGMTRHFFGSYYGADFRRIFETHGVAIDNISCEYGGGGAAYMQFESPRFAGRAADASHRRLCRLPDAVFDDDYANEARDQLEDFCARLGGTVVTPASSSQTKDHRPPLPAAVKRCKTGSLGHTLPAALLDSSASNIPTEILIPANAWSAGDCQTQTWVYAGAAGWTNGTAIFVITRTKEPTSYIVIPGSGAPRITHAPLGPKVITSAQRQGELRFTSRRGITGILSLANDTATLTTGEVIQPTHHPRSKSS